MKFGIRFREDFFGEANSDMNNRTLNKADRNEVRTAMKDGIRRSAGMLRFAQLALVAVMALVFGMAGFVADADAALVTYHMRGLAAQSVGFDGSTNVVSEAAVSYQPINATQWRAIASTTPSTSTSRNRFREGVAWTGTSQFLRVYSPPYAAARIIGANATCSFDLYSAAATVYATLYEYNDTTGVVGAVKGTTNTLNISTVPSHNILTFNNAAFTVATGNRLVVYYYLTSANLDPRPIFGAAAYNSVTPAGDLYFVVDETVAATNGTIALSAATYAVGEAGPTVTITATRTGGSTGIVGISYATSNGTASAGSDYTTTSGTLSWGDGDTANKTFTVPVTQDTLDEINETFTVTLSTPTGGALLGTPSAATVTVTDDDTAPTVGFSAATSSGSEITTAVLIPVTLSTASGQTVTVNYATSAGTATANVDYGTTSGTLTFLPGETSKNVPVTVANDANPETDETFIVTLSAPSNATLGTSPHTYTILNDDLAGSIQLTSATYTVSEGGSNMVLTATRTGGSAGVVGVSYATSNGTATAGNDYTATSGTLSWGAGVTTNQTIIVPILEDVLSEPSETFTVTLSTPTGFATLGAPSSAVVTITDNDCLETGTVTVAISPDPGAGNITGAVTVSATLGGGASNGQVRWRVDGGPWNVWLASGAVFTPPSKSNGSVDFEAMADGNCGVTSPVYSSTLSKTYETRIAALEPIQAIAAQNGLTKIRATMIYCNDLNNSGRFKVEYKLAAGSTYTVVYDGITGAIDGGIGDVDTVWNDEVIVDIDLGASPTYALYDIRMTFVDGTDGLTGGQPAVWNVQVNLVSWSDNAMLHNANRFACSITGYATQATCVGAGGIWDLNRKYIGGWGIPGQQYGAIMCNTCHVKGSGNIKRITATVVAPSGSFPGSAVAFTSAVDGSSNFGDDAVGHATSTKVCEACHSLTTVHRYNTTGQPGGLVHYNQADCTKCHEHKAGFRASCTSCHGNPPLAAGELTGPLPGDDTGSTSWGAHNTHAEALGFVCNTCHTGWETTGEMPKVGNINIGFNAFGKTAGTYDGRVAPGGKYTAGTGLTLAQTKASNTTTCAIYCHGYGVPQWTTTAGTVTCGACHGEPGSYLDGRAGAPTGVAASRDLSGATTGFKVGKHANHLDDSVTATGDPCLLCHQSGAAHFGGTIDGTVQVTLNTTYAGPTATFTAGAPGTCSNLSCHGTAVWDSAAVGGCDFCHGYPPNATNNKHAGGVQAVNHDSLNITPNHDQCTYCHGYKDNGTGSLLLLTPAQITALKGTWTPTATAHQDGSVTMNGGPTTADAGYNATTGACDSAACHANDATHRVGAGNTTSTKLLVAIGPGACGTCHDAGTGGAPVVTSTSTHVKVTKVAVYGDCTDCHAGHTTATGGVDIPNNATVGINYSTAGHAGIQLGGTGTNATIAALTTEAQICWACHDNASNAISEWGTNAGTGSTYDYGNLTAGSNWVGATWNSGTAKFGYKSGVIQSTHTANPSAAPWNGPTVPGVDTVAQIRCSYCHDVHNLNRATGDTLSGAPYLRGTWMGNPYREDGAPQAGDTWTATGLFGAVPRGGTSSVELGGYQIDQNNGNPTSTWTANSSAGLCELCHGNGDGNFTAAEIDTLNQFGTASTDWVGTNGHSAAVLGGGDSVASNIFRILDRNTTAPVFANGDAPDGGNPAMAQQNVALGIGNRPFSFRSSTAEPDGWNLTPRVTNRYAQDGYTWGADTNNALDANYHNFSCSKCHNPHASRLPRLMISNCLDTKHNTWDDGQSTIPNGTTNVDGSSTVSANNSNVKFSNATSAQNCHRVKDPAFTQSRGTGWNYVTPW